MYYVIFFSLDPADYMAYLNATTYVAEITADTPFGTPVLYFSAVVDGSAFTLPVVLLTLVENNLVERVFTFRNGRMMNNILVLLLILPPTPLP